MGKYTSKPIDTNLVKELFEYRDGGLFWAANKGRAKKGNGAYISSAGYKVLKFNGTPYLEHRLIWAWHGKEPADCLDHINGNCLDNRIENLRAATKSENMRNSKMRSDNRSGVKGAYRCNDKNKWKVAIAVDGKQKYVGSFKDIKTAKIVADTFREKAHKQFANIGA